MPEQDDDFTLGDLMPLDGMSEEEIEHYDLLARIAASEEMRQLGEDLAWEHRNDLVRQAEQEDRERRGLPPFA